MTNQYEIIIIGGSYAGLSAALTLGRSKRKVLIIDGGKPCNAPTPHAHNFLTHDGQNPREIARIGKEQVLAYPTVRFESGTVSEVVKHIDGFAVKTEDGGNFIADKIIVATGIRDLFPSIEGFAECWGISAVHCPYCHGFELSDRPTAILANGEMAMHYAKLVYNLSKDITILTNGRHAFGSADITKLTAKNIHIIDSVIKKINHEHGQITSVEFEGRPTLNVTAMYAGLPMEQHSDIPHQLGCEIDENGLIKVDAGQQTTIDGVFACGDNSSMRSLSVAVQTGMVAGAYINMLLCEEAF
ncbi:NAD(P)/FAD-dependent oxidoreductase [Crocinitomix catalasitica]|uniref:NAD(P)/FAD-dependent oxidoreductase n=1 Tax=Crocinitomix catalasitica TaxID=184607 RepID=UPI000486E91C|nr:NAD(P)/FAD-dependent oxidoreductase [Crocinitomix catalasitica]